jgi:hypothetical protein
VFVALVPPSVDNLGHRCVFAITLEFFIRYAGLFALLLQRLGKRIVCSSIGIGIFVSRAGGGFGGLRRVVEDGPIETSNPVEQEVIDLVMLP